MKIFLTSQTQELDQYTILNEPVASIDLMERASVRFADAFQAEVSPSEQIIVLAGPGNNGGDALAVARILTGKGYTVKTYLFNPENRLSTDCETNKNRLLSLPGIAFNEQTSSFSIDISPGNIIIDGLFGSGLNRPLSGDWATLVRQINRSKVSVFSIDIPSGLAGESCNPEMQDTIIQATKTFTFQFPKLAFLFPENELYTGEWKVLDIGLHPDTLQKISSPFFYTEKKDVAPLIPQRSRFAHKGNFGHALLIAGSYGKLGAALLAAKACLRSGTGLLTSCIPGCGYSVFQTSLPETMVLTDKQQTYITDLPDLSAYNAVAIGPGIGLYAETAGMLRLLLRKYRNPLILDADALNIIAQHKDLLELIPRGSILTPHPKELDRLSGSSSSSYERLQKALKLAGYTQCYVLLKGAFTAVCTPEKNCYFNPTGNPGMATAGSGDVLTGILLGLLSQSGSPLNTSLAGVYLHGSAGDLAATSYSQESMIAGDITEHLGKAFQNLQ